ncbi:metal-dependent transcriptional regulator [Falsarthrobacter nasiphocae]
MYLRTILELKEEGVPALRARIAERLHHSGPTVSQTVARMERDGLVEVTADRHLEFTDEGQRRATEVMRKHRLAERLLSDVIGLDWELVHDEACRWEHVMSERVERRLLELLESPTVSPYGNPIPGLEAIGGDAAEPFGEGVVTATAAVRRAGGAPVRGVIARLAEPIQVDGELLVQLRECGLVPGAEVDVQERGAFLRMSAVLSGEGLELPLEDAAHLFLRLS